jgi:tartrate-resistant acid phosphatase type 5
MNKKMKLSAIAAGLALTGCGSESATPSFPVNFIVVGDAGYHHDYLDPEDLGINAESLLAMERKDWMEKGKPIEEFKLFPTYTIPGTTDVIEQSGQQAVGDAIARYCQTQPCDFMTLLGDNIYPDGADGSGEDAERFQKILHDPYAAIGVDDPSFQIYAALGNHDWDTSFEGRTSQISFGQTDQRYELREPGYYSYRRGNAEFFVLDTNMLLAGTTVYEDELDENGHPVNTGEISHKEPYEHPVNGDDLQQLSWLKASLESSDAKWKIVYGHHTLWSSGGSKYEEAIALRRLLMPMLCENADLYMAGHEHDLGIHQDTCEGVLGHADSPLNLVISGAGSKQRSIHSRFQAHQIATNTSYRSIYNQGMVWGFSHISLDGNQATIEMITTPNDQSGEPVVSFRYHFKPRTD